MTRKKMTGRPTAQHVRWVIARKLIEARLATRITGYPPAGEAFTLDEIVTLRQHLKALRKAADDIERTVNAFLGEGRR